MASLAILTIGTATSRIDLLNPRGLMLSDWRPQATSHDTTFAESALSDGRQAAASRDLNAIETFELKLNTFSTDDAARMIQEMRRTLRGGIKYWTSGDPSLVPVYLEARAACETNSRYALVYDAQMPEDDNYYRQPFMQMDGDRVMDGLSLIVERGPWLENAPGEGTCVQTSGAQYWGSSQTTVTATPGASTDDAWYYLGLTNINLTSVILPLGYYTDGHTYVAVRFPTVNVPQGATILNAYVTFEMALDSRNTQCNVSIKGEYSDDAATFSTYSNLVTRPKTAKGISWVDITPANQGDALVTPDLTPIIQLIVDRPGWVANNDMALFFQDLLSDPTPANRAAASWDNVTYDAPVLTIVYATGSSYGRAATCEDEVFLANKHNQAQLTHVFINDGGVYSANLIGAALPTDLLPAAPANGDEIYFGIQSSVVNSGPFSNLAFDVGTAATYTGAAYMSWYYYSTAGGGTWVALQVSDNTGGPQSFSETGVNSVHWIQPSTWTTVAVNGVTAYWVKAVCVIGGGGEAITTPTQRNRNIYTVDWPYAEIDDAQVGGDMPALARIKLRNVSEGDDTPALYSTRTAWGMRNLDRGEDFTAFINLSDEQNPAGITVSLGSGGYTTWIDDMTAPTGRAVHYDGGAGAFSSIILVTLEDSINSQYFGRYRAFVRYRLETSGTVASTYLRLLIEAGGNNYYTDRQLVTTYFTTTPYFTADMGVITLPALPYPSTELFFSGLRIYLQAWTFTGSVDLIFTDLILIPIDEITGEYIASSYLRQNGAPYHLARPRLQGNLIDKPLPALK